MTSYCTFHLHGLYFGVDVLRVQEIIRNCRVVPVPLAPRAVMGLMNLRGQLVTVVDLRRRLDLPDRTEAGGMQIVLRSGGDPRSLVVDEMGDVIDVPAADVQSTPATLSGISGELTLGACPLADRLLLLLDLDRIVNL